jgi:hypothetical protein
METLKHDTAFINYFKQEMEDLDILAANAAIRETIGHAEHSGYVYSKYGKGAEVGSSRNGRGSEYGKGSEVGSSRNGKGSEYGKGSEVGSSRNLVVDGVFEYTHIPYGYGYGYRAFRRVLSTGDFCV